VVIALVAARWLPPDSVERSRQDGGPPRRRLVRVDALLLVLGAIGFCSALGEGAMADWSALFLHTVLRADEGLAAAGYAAFSIAMAVSRFGGAAVLARYDPGRVLTTGCALAAV